MPDISETAAEATHLLATGDYYAVLRCLNASTPHRFTALYRREDDRAWNVLLYDKQNPYTPQFPEVAASETYCSMAIESHSLIVVENSLTDPRLTDHAARAVVRSYCGAPLADASGTPFGTLCNFDFAPLATPDDVAELMELLSRLMGGATATEVLQSDVARRMENLAGTLSHAASSLHPQEAWEDVFDELAEPIRALLTRMPQPAAASVEASLAALREEFVAKRAPYPPGPGRVEDGVAGPV